MNAGLESLDRIPLVMHRACRTSKIEDSIDLDIKRKGDVVPHQFEVRLADQRNNVLLAAGEKVVGHSGVVGGGLIQVAVRVHTTGRHQLALGVDVVLTRRQVLTDRLDMSIQDANVGRVTIAGRGDVRVSNDGVE